MSTSRGAIYDLVEGAKRAPLWLRLAYTDIQQTYKRTLIGMSWIILSFAMFIGVKLLIFGAISTVDPTLYAVWLTVGFWVWTYVIGNIMSGSTVFISSKPWILGTSLPLSVYVYQSMVRELIKFAFSGIVVVGFIIWLKWPAKTEWLWAILGFLALVINSIWVHFFLGILCSRHRDFVHFVQAMIRVLFFLTPILYLPEQLGETAKYLKFNPFTHFIAVMRDPITHGTVPVLSWYVVGAFTVIGTMVSLIVLRQYKNRVPFWV
ncbi:MAG TPA: hypothetical protein ENJ42_06925 [Hellea balneolensis]|uniref:Uncharacterized protein n=1 Tax=Hellea balneolensis TaxID=287478 RepID=A0A7C5LUQ8_9PROT|nr:hypothetical protein [Hellea balneolensis]